ncbi:hypothetical protein IKT18_00270 [Candidatus Saccharibacteria bacterium]|nr:hypothetical protein [Candidatus Saccharibacteria bacterium]
MSRRRRNRRWVFKVIVPMFVVVVACIVWASFLNGGDKGDDGIGVGDEEVYTLIADDEELENDSEKEESSGNIDDYVNKRPIQYDGGSPNELEYLTGVVNYVKTNGGKLLIRVSIDQYLEEGTCELVLLQEGNIVYQETTDIVGDATTSTCKGFDVPMASLISGEVQFTIYLSSDDRVGEVNGGAEI